jgi:hypothetical protein
MILVIIILFSFTLTLCTSIVNGWFQFSIFIRHFSIIFQRGVYVDFIQVYTRIWVIHLTMVGRIMLMLMLVCELAVIVVRLLIVIGPVLLLLIELGVQHLSNSECQVQIGVDSLQ